MQILGGSNGHFELVGPAIPIINWRDMATHTIAIYMTDFQGRIHIDGTLAMEPTEADWFPIHLNGHIPYREYPVNSRRPTGRMGDTGVEGFSFTANVTYLRARLTRDHLPHRPTTPEQIAQLGVIDKIIKN